MSNNYALFKLGIEDKKDLLGKFVQIETIPGQLNSSWKHPENGIKVVGLVENKGRLPEDSILIFASDLNLDGWTIREQRGSEWLKSAHFICAASRCKVRLPDRCRCCVHQDDKLLYVCFRFIKKVF